MQAEMVLKRELKVLHLDPQETGSGLSVTLSQALSKETSKPTPKRTHFLQQSETFSNKAIPPNNATSYELTIVNYIQTTTTSIIKIVYK